MACSKVLLGNFPELTDDIIQYLQDDIPTLHSCVLVNRFWCHIVIPLLWKDPFSKKNPKNFHFIEIYLHKLSEKDKKQLNRCGIKNNVFPSNALFNYSFFIKCINTQNICSTIVNWFKTNKTFSCSKGRIFSLLIKVFIENEAKLHTFEIDIAYNYLISRKYFKSAFKLITQNPKFISNIKYLKLYINEKILKYDLDYKILECFYKNCNLISLFHIGFSKYERFSYNHITIEDQLSKIINSQKNLEKIIFAHNKYTCGAYFLDTSIPLYNIISGSNNTNQLKIIIFHKIDFRNILHIKKAFEQLNFLESIHIIDCLIFNYNFIQQINELNKPFKLRSLFINEYVFRSEDEDKNLKIESIQLLFQKFGEYLENIGFESIVNCELKYRVLEFINNYCEKVKYFEVYTSSIQKAHIVLDSVKIFGQNLNYLTISAFIYYNKTDDMRELFLRLAHVLPCKLEYLNLICSTEFTKYVWEVFLKNLNHIFIKKLLFKISILVVDILPYVKEYIIKENIAECLAIKGYIEIPVSENKVHRCKKDLFNMTDELKEFESYNIKVKEYSDLYIKAYEFIDEMY